VLPIAAFVSPNVKGRAEVVSGSGARGTICQRLAFSLLCFVDALACDIAFDRLLVPFLQLVVCVSL
jgi:hypothetical protein